jgi:hypothetical protein
MAVLLEKEFCFLLFTMTGAGRGCHGARRMPGENPLCFRLLRFDLCTKTGKERRTGRAGVPKSGLPLLFFLLSGEA